MIKNNLKKSTLLKAGGDQMKRSYFQTIYTTEKF